MAFAREPSETSGHHSADAGPPPGRCVNVVSVKVICLLLSRGSIPAHSPVSRASWGKLDVLLIGRESHSLSLWPQKPAGSRVMLHACSGLPENGFVLSCLLSLSLVFPVHEMCGQSACLLALIELWYFFLPSFHFFLQTCVKHVLCTRQSLWSLQCFFVYLSSLSGTFLLPTFLSPVLYLSLTSKPTLGEVHLSAVCTLVAVFLLLEELAFDIWSFIVVANGSLFMKFSTSICKQGRYLQNRGPSQNLRVPPSGDHPLGICMRLALSLTPFCDQIRDQNWLILEKHANIAFRIKLQILSTAPKTLHGVASYLTFYLHLAGKPHWNLFRCLVEISVLLVNPFRHANSSSCGRCHFKCCFFQETFCDF